MGLLIKKSLKLTILIFSLHIGCKNPEQNEKCSVLYSENDVTLDNIYIQSGNEIINPDLEFDLNQLNENYNSRLTDLSEKFSKLECKETDLNFEKLEFANSLASEVTRLYEYTGKLEKNELQVFVTVPFSISGEYNFTLNDCELKLLNCILNKMESDNISIMNLKDISKAFSSNVVLMQTFQGLKKSTYYGNIIGSTDNFTIMTFLLQAIIKNHLMKGAKNNGITLAPKIKAIRDSFNSYVNKYPEIKGRIVNINDSLMHTNLQKAN